MRYDRVFVTIGEDGFSPNYYLRFVAYFPFALCSLPCHVSEKDPEHKGASYNGMETIASSTAFLFHDLFERCYMCAFDGGQKYLEPREEQHLVGQDC